MVTEPSEEDYKASNAKEYTSTALWLYDLLVLKLIASFVWRCPTYKFTLPFFRANVTSCHLDVGVATGYFTANHNFPRASELTMCDLNQTCLKTAKARLKRPDMICKTLQHDILNPLPESIGKFDSISMFYLLHCLPGPVPRKTAIFSHIKHHLTPNGSVFGSTILGERRCHTKFSYWFLESANRGPFLRNLGDTERYFVGALHKNFLEVETNIIGAVFLFKATGPIV